MSLNRRQQVLTELATGARRLRLSNAQGMCKVLEGPHGLRELCRIPALTTVNIGTFRFKAYPGNPGLTEYLSIDGSAINFKGIPTAKDFDVFCREDLPLMVHLVHEADKQICVSINDSDPHVLVDMIRLLDAAGVDNAEVNLACPNLEDGEMICYLEPSMREMFEIFDRECKLRIGIGVKAGIYSNPAELARFGKLLLEFLETIFFVTAVNTFPNCMLFDEAGDPVIKSGSGLGGGSGTMLKAIAPGQVHQLRGILGPGYHINGAGGVSTGRDVIDMYLAGASEVQVGSAYYFGGPSVFTSLQSGIVE